MNEFDIYPEFVDQTLQPEYEKQDLRESETEIGRQEDDVLPFNKIVSNKVKIG